MSGAGVGGARHTVVLGGGGVRGIAHVGVLRALSERVADKTDFLPAQVEELAAEPANLRAVKESSGDVRRVTALKALLGDRLALFVGLDDVVVEGVRAGGETIAVPFAPGSSLVVFSDGVTDRTESDEEGAQQFGMERIRLAHRQAESRNAVDPRRNAEEPAAFQPARTPRLLRTQRLPPMASLSRRADSRTAMQERRTAR